MPVSVQMYTMAQEAALPEKGFLTTFFFTDVFALMCFALEPPSRSSGVGVQDRGCWSWPGLQQGACLRWPRLMLSCCSSHHAPFLPSLCWISHAFEPVQIHFGALKPAANHLPFL